MNITVANGYEHLSGWLSEMPRSFDEQQGTLIYDGRNQIRLFAVGGMKLVVKRYKRHDWFKRLAYTFFRKDKARRSFENAMMLRDRGFRTPHEVAFLEVKCAGVITQVYYVCEYTDAQPIRLRLIDQEPFDESLAVAYARYVASLHGHGVLHRDLNPTNVLFTETDGEYGFEMIDINRMRFFESQVPKALCMENLTLFWWLTEVYRFVLGVYAETRGWTDDDVQQAVAVKQRHDRRWVRRKKVTGKLKSLFR